MLLLQLLFRNKFGLWEPSFGAGTQGQTVCLLFVLVGHSRERAARSTEQRPAEFCMEIKYFQIFQLRNKTVWEGSMGSINPYCFKCLAFVTTVLYCNSVLAALLEAITAPFTWSLELIVICSIEFSSYFQSISLCSQKEISTLGGTALVGGKTF